MTHCSVHQKYKAVRKEHGGGGSEKEEVIFEQVASKKNLPGLNDLNTVWLLKNSVIRNM